MLEYQKNVKIVDFLEDRVKDIQKNLDDIQVNFIHKVFDQVNTQGQMAEKKINQLTFLQNSKYLEIEKYVQDLHHEVSNIMSKKGQNVEEIVDIQSCQNSIDNLRAFSEKQ